MMLRTFSFLLLFFVFVLGQSVFAQVNDEDEQDVLDVVKKVEVLIEKVEGAENADDFSVERFSFFLSHFLSEVEKAKIIDPLQIMSFNTQVALRKARELLTEGEVEKALVFAAHALDIQYRRLTIQRIFMEEMDKILKEKRKELKEESLEKRVV